MKRVLITGEHSYIGIAVKEWLQREPDKYHIESTSVREDKWKKIKFNTYDVVFHVAGIAHVSSNPKLKQKYYEVNRDLTIAIAKKAKLEGVKQFIFMSSIIVYGTQNEIIDQHTQPNPDNYYGDSKLQAETGIKLLETPDYKVVILRPPMIYGKNSKGNYQRLALFARTTPLFPNYKNKRSILYIDNLCELVRLIIEQNKNGIFFPQNENYIKTSDIVRCVAELNSNQVYMPKVFNPIINILVKTGLFSKVFGSLYYHHSMSEYDNMPYRIQSFKRSIELTESAD